MWNSIKLSIIFGITTFFFFGCASKQQTIQEKIVLINQQDEEVRYRPIIGSRNSDSKVIKDAGVTLKIWIAPYVTKTGFMVSGHDVYYDVVKPRFIAGSSVPNRNRGVGAITPVRKLPFSLSPNEINRSDLNDDEVILQFRDNTQNLKKHKVIKKSSKASQKKPTKILPKSTLTPNQTKKQSKGESK